MDKLHPFSISLEGRHLVEASAGTGKTYNITSIFVRCLAEKEIEVNEILVLTYTKAATAELKDRILTRLRESVYTLKQKEAAEDDEFLFQLLSNVSNKEQAVEKLEKALHNFDEASIFTIHSFCQRALQEQSFLSGILFDSELVSDDSDLVQEVIDDWWRNLVDRADSSETDRIWLHILEEENYYPDSLVQFVSTGIGKPYLEIKCQKPVGESRDEELMKLAQLFKELTLQWEGNELLIQQMLLSEAMNGNRYRATSVPDWIDELDHWLQSELPSLNPIEKFDRFSIDFIRNKGTKKGHDAPDHSFFHTAQQYIDQMNRVRSWLPTFKKDLLEDARQNVRRKKLSQGVLGYDDLLNMLHEALQRPTTGSELAGLLRSKYPVALVDEFQDTDPIQYEILTSIYSAASSQTGLFLIGDPKQSIYSFRGADVFSYLEARNEVSVENRYGLFRNFRSHKNLIRAVNSIFERMDEPFFVDDIPFSSVQAAESKEVPPLLVYGKEEPLVQFLRSEHTDASEYSKKDDARKRAASVTAESIASLLNKGTAKQAIIGDDPVTSKEIAVLVRTHNQAEMIRQALEARSVKSVQYSEKSIFETKEARNMELLLKAVAEPRNERAIRTALATELFSCTAEDLINFRENEQQWTQILEQFTGWNHLWQEQGFIPMFRIFLRDAEVQAHLGRLVQGERKLTNTLQLGELLQAREQEARGSMFELINWLAHKRADADKNAEEEQLRLESDEDLVRIVTMHRSKGLEYPIVYCPFLWDGANISNTSDPILYHDENSNYRASLDLNRKDFPERNQHRYWAAKEDISESLRLAYVAMTRAKQRCTIIMETANAIEFSSLGYLLLGKSKVEQQLRAKIFDDAENLDIAPSDYLQELEKLVERNAEFLCLNMLDEEEGTLSQESRERDELSRKNRTLDTHTGIRSRSVVSSFSSIMHPSSSQGPDPADDEFFLPEELHTPDPDQKQHNIFGFPKGPQAGTCVHTIFEDLEFADLKDSELTDVVQKNLEQFGFDIKWTGVLAKMVRCVLGYRLKENLQLKHLKASDLLKEMEFYFDLSSFHTRLLVELLRPGSSGIMNRVPEGFMKGYIDLIFRSGDTFYIADHKTNYLGDSIEDYHPELLKNEMQLAGYDVQYHIYAIALHRYLQSRMPGYSYDRNFGGVYYLFVRGMSEESSSTGIYFEKPTKSTIDALDKLFGKEDLQSYG